LDSAGYYTLDPVEIRFQTKGKTTFDNQDIRYLHQRLLELLLGLTLLLHPLDSILTPTTAFLLSTIQPQNRTNMIVSLHPNLVDLPTHLLILCFIIPPAGDYAPLVKFSYKT